jgi:hypothetical protein
VISADGEDILLAVGAVVVSAVWLGSAGSLVSLFRTVAAGSWACFGLRPYPISGTGSEGKHIEMV